jgi:hypothetical protein
MYPVTFRFVQQSFRWLDSTPMSRVVARCTQDMESGINVSDNPRRLRSQIFG